MNTNENKLPKEFKDKWVAALRSGEFKQGKRFLYDNNDGEETFCCMGVAGIVCGIPKENMMSRVYFDSYGNIATRTVPPPGLPKLLDASSSYTTVQTLANLNDSQSKSFLEIADYIEANL